LGIAVGVKTKSKTKIRKKGKGGRMEESSSLLDSTGRGLGFVFLLYELVTN
jgi:hypothetical protein